MENASKALLMAGGVLISLMIISLLIWMFSSLSRLKEGDVETTRETQILEFNRQFETYMRNDVRGSDIYSLLNRVIDYNRRKSAEGTGSDEGQYLAYEPMTVTIDITSIRSQLSADGGTNYYLFKNNTYVIQKNSNTFENNINNEVLGLENTYGKESLNSLCTALTKIFIEDSRDSSAKKEAVANFNKISKKVTISDYNEIKNGSNIRKDIYKYYELVQFKRAHFNYVPTNNDYSKIGRVKNIKFEANGKFE